MRESVQSLEQGSDGAAGNCMALMRPWRFSVAAGQFIPQLTDAERLLGLEGLLQYFTRRGRGDLAVIVRSELRRVREKFAPQRQPMMSLYALAKRLTGETKGKASLLSVLSLEMIRGQQCAELAEELGVSASSVTRAVDRLTERGLAERRHVPGDRRAYEVHLTSAGREALTAVRRCFVAIAAGISAGEGAGV